RSRSASSIPFAGLPVALKRTGLLTARNSPPATAIVLARRGLSAISRPPALIVPALAHGPNAAATVMRALPLADRDHAQPPQPSFHHPERMLVDNADFAQPELVVRKLMPACLAGVRKCAPAHSEAARPIEFAQQPQRDLVETSHAPSDTLVVVDCVGSHYARIRR